MMNVALNTLQVVKSLWRIQTNETVVYAQYPAGEPPVLDPSIAHLVRCLKKDQLVLLFRKRLANSDQVSLIAVGVSPDITKKKPLLWSIMNKS